MSPHNMTETPRHSVSVAAAIFDDSGENVLLIKRRDNGHWEPPGGVLELDETVEEGLRREVHEETGVDIEIGPLTGVYKNMSRGIVALVFRCAALNAPQETTAEAQETAWIDMTRVSETMEAVYAARMLDAQSIAADHSAVAIRAHDGSRFF